MFYSKLLIPTLKEEPGEAEIESHKLLLRAGMIRKISSGIYTYLPLAKRCIDKIERIIREEMQIIGAQEVLLPFVQPSEIWEESGRWRLYGKELVRLKDRHDHDFCLGPTHEEVITHLIKREVKSYRNLPQILYQIQTKFRDEIRPRFGLLRAREFIMKDAYSFDQDDKGAEQSYGLVEEAYNRIFKRCGVKFREVLADTGLMGGKFSHEFMVLAPSGEDTIATCNSCGYAANREMAEVGQRPQEADLANPNHFKEMKKVFTPGLKSVEEVSQFLGLRENDLAKTIILQGGGQFISALLPGNYEINLIKLKNYLGWKEMELASDEIIEEVTLCEKGFAGPVGLKIPIYADFSLKGMINFVTGANEKDRHLTNVNLGRDFTVDEFLDLKIVEEGDPCPQCNGSLQISKGIEVGHIFKLGTRYSEAFNASYLDAHGQERHIVMGCYGIGVTRLFQAVIEQCHDKDGIIFPFAVSPFEVIIIPISSEDQEIKTVGEALHKELEKRKVEVLYDDRDLRPGVKFKDADLLGICLKVILGVKNIREGKIEIQQRADRKSVLINIDDAANYLIRFIEEGSKTT